MCTYSASVSLSNSDLISFLALMPIFFLYKMIPTKNECVSYILQRCSGEIIVHQLLYQCTVDQLSAHCFLANELTELLIGKRCHLIVENRPKKCKIASLLAYIDEKKKGVNEK